VNYRSVKIGERIVHIPDDELKRYLRGKIGSIRRNAAIIFSNEVNVFSRKGGLVAALRRHQARPRGRFFIIIDFVYAFHQITRGMIAEILPEINDSSFDLCFVVMGRKEVLPIGFPTSPFLFEFFMSRIIDPRLIEWQKKHGGVVTRYCDNILVTWRKNTPVAFQDLVRIFSGLEVRFTPKKPKKWEEPIRFCGLLLCPDGRIELSCKKRKELLTKAREERKKGRWSVAQGIESFVSSLSR